MFTGIIENQGIITEVSLANGNKTLWIESPLSGDFKIDQSVSHSGVCLTVEAVHENRHKVTAIQETLLKSTIGTWKEGEPVNLERCMTMNGRFDGHIVQGHVDTQGSCIDVTENEGSWEFRIRFPRQFAHLVVEKGSICINGISLTAFDVSKEELSVGIIPYTYSNTNISHLRKGQPVNIEFDVIGKYIQRWHQLQ
jgi:riboflavin synthase